MTIQIGAIFTFAILMTPKVKVRKFQISIARYLDIYPPFQTDRVLTDIGHGGQT